MKILYLTHRLDTPSTRWRVLQMVPHLKRQGWTVAVTPIPKGLFSQIGLLGQVPAYDVVVLQKRLMPVWWMKLLRRKAAKLVYEFDDTVMMKHRDGAAVPSRTRRKRFEYIVRHSDAVITSNEYLASLCIPYGPREKITLISNAVDLHRWEPRKAYAASEKITVGWLGSSGNLLYLREVAEVLGAMQREDPRVVFEVVCERPYSDAAVAVVHKEFSAATEPEDLRSFDIAIAPMADNEWTRGKQTMKILTYFCAGLPVIASDVPACRVWIDHGGNGFLARSSEDWRAYLKQLIGDERLRERLGRAARRTAEEKYGVEKISLRLVDVLQRLAQGSERT